MPRLVLPGGTDVAEVAIFSLDALPQRSDRDTVTKLERERSLILFNTGADGAYLLHAYVDEPVPDDLLKYCVIADRKIATLNVSGGRVGFGGSESTYAEFSPNAAIRTDARMSPGTYEVVAYRASYPDDLIDRAVRERIGASGQRLLGLPGFIIPVGLLLALACWFLSLWYAVAVISATAVAVLLFTKHPVIAQLQAGARAAELEYPSIVLNMTSKPTSNSPENPSP